MRPTLLLLGFRCREAARGVRQNAFVLFALGPLIIGGALFIAGRYLDLVRAPLRIYAELLPTPVGTGAWTPPSPGPLGLTLALALVVLHLPGALYELFHRGASLDAVPAGERARFLVAAAAAWGRQISSAVALLIALAVLGETTAPARLLAWGVSLLAALLPLALLALLAAALRVRFVALGRFQRRALGGVLLVTLALALATPDRTSFLLLPLWPSAVWLEALLRSALLAAPFATPAPGWLLSATAALGLAAGGLTVRYRRRDLERAASLARQPRAGRGAARLLGRRRAVRVLLGRDLLLVGRRFSPAVDLTVALAGLILAAIVLILPGFGLDLAAALKLGVLATVAATLVLTTLVPLLVKHQLPRFWSERTSAVANDDVGRAKLWLARCLALPPAVVGGAALAVLPGALERPTLLAAAVVQLLIAEWIVASIVGHTVFEIAAQPLLGIVFSSLAGLSIAALFVLYPRAWWLWLVFYLVLANKLAERAAERVSWTEVEI